MTTAPHFRLHHRKCCVIVPDCTNDHMTTCKCLIPVCTRVPPVPPDSHMRCPLESWMRPVMSYSSPLLVLLYSDTVTELVNVSDSKLDRSLETLDIEDLDKNVLV